jgi:hypothetical protein
MRIVANASCAITWHSLQVGEAVRAHLTKIIHTFNVEAVLRTDIVGHKSDKHGCIVRKFRQLVAREGCVAVSWMHECWWRKISSWGVRYAITQAIRWRSSGHIFVYSLSSNGTIYSNMVPMQLGMAIQVKHCGSHGITWFNKKWSRHTDLSAVYQQIYLRLVGKCQR